MCVGGGVPDYDSGASHPPSHLPPTVRDQGPALLPQHWPHHSPPNWSPTSSLSSSSISFIFNRSYPVLKVASSWCLRLYTSHPPTCPDHFMAPTVLCAQRCLINVC